MLAAAIAAAWLAMIVGATLWHPIAGAPGLAALFAAQTVAAWKLLRIHADRGWWTTMSETDRERWIVGGLVAIAVAAAAAIITVSLELSNPVG
ncbi:MAG: hypothetical protein AAGF47_03555 [Planctomycetota bacterium]